MKNKMFLDSVQLLMIGWVIRAKTLSEMQKNWKRPPKSSKNKMFVFQLHQLLMIGRAIWAKKVDFNTKKWKGPLSHRKIKCSFLDYIQLLMIGRAIRAKNDDQNKKTKKVPKSLKNKMFVFGLCSTSDHWLSDLSKKHWPRCKKNEKGPLSHQKMKCSFLDYVQLLMIGWGIQAKNVDQNTRKQKKAP